MCTCDCCSAAWLGPCPKGPTGLDTNTPHTSAPHIHPHFLHWHAGMPEVLEGAVIASTTANINSPTAACATAASGKQAAAAAGTAVVSAAGSGRAGAAAGAQAEGAAAGGSKGAVGSGATRGGDAAVESEASRGSETARESEAAGGEGAGGVSAGARARLYQPACEEFEVQSIEVSLHLFSVKGVMKAGAYQGRCTSSEVGGWQLAQC